MNAQRDGAHIAGGSELGGVLALVRKSVELGEKAGLNACAVENVLHVVVLRLSAHAYVWAFSQLAKACCASGSP